MSSPLFPILLVASYPLLLVLTSKIPYKFRSFYNPGKSLERIQEDTARLEPFVCEFNDALSRMHCDASGTAEFECLLSSSLASSPRLRKASAWQIRRNLEDLLIELGIMGGGHFYFDNFNITPQIAALDLPEMIFFNSSEGYDDEVMRVLFQETASLRTNGPQLVVRAVEQGYEVQFQEAIDEIVWLCISRNCVNLEVIDNLNIVIKTFSKVKTVLSFHEKHPELVQPYIDLNLARMKVLFHKAFFERFDFKPIPLDNMLNSHILMSVVSALLFSGFLVFLGYKFIPRNGSIARPSVPRLKPKIIQLTTVARKSRVGLTLAIVLMLVVVVVGAFWYKYVRKKDEDEAESAATSEGGKGTKPQKNKKTKKRSKEKLNTKDNGQTMWNRLWRSSRPKSSGAGLTRLQFLPRIYKRSDETQNVKITVRAASSVGPNVTPNRLGSVTLMTSGAPISSSTASPSTPTSANAKKRRKQRKTRPSTSQRTPSSDIVEVAVKKKTKPKQRVESDLIP